MKYRRIFLFALLLVSLFLTPFTASSSPTFEYSLIPELSDLSSGNLFTNFSTSLAIPYIGSSNGIKTISESTPLLIPETKGEGNLNINVLSAKQDLLRENNKTLATWLSSSSGLLNYALDSQTTPQILTITANDLTLDNYLSVPINIPVQGNDTIELGISSCDFSYGNASYAYFKLEVTFDTFKTVFVLDGDPNYLGTLYNDSKIVTLLYTDTSYANISIAQLANIAGIQNPTQINSIVWKASSFEDTFQLAASFDHLALVRNSSNVTLSSQSSVPYIQSQLFLPFDTNSSILLQPTSDTTAVISWNYADHSYLELTGELAANTSSVIPELSLTGVINTTDFQYFSKLTIPYFLHLTNFSISGGQNNGTCIELYPLGNSYQFQAQLKPLATSVHLPSLQQGNAVNVSFTTYSAYLFSTMLLLHESDSFVSNTTIQNTGILDLPSQWPSGKATLFAWTKYGEFTYYATQFALSPAQPLLDAVITVNPAINQRVPVYLENITSQEPVLATSITTYYQGTLRSTDGPQGIILEPGDFPIGNHLLSVLAVAPGLVPVKFEILLQVEMVSPTIEITLTRSSPTAAEIEINIEELANWSIGYTVVVSGSGIEYQQYSSSKLSVLTIQNNSWKEKKAYPINIAIILDYNLGAFNFSRELDLWNGNSLDQNSPSGVGFYLFAAFLVSGSALAYYVYKRKIDADTISF